MNGFIVFMGGGFGALTRYLLSLILPKAMYFPAGTLVANFFGCFIATAVFTYLVSKTDAFSAHRTFLIIGFCGGLSTLSALSLELLEFVQTGEYLRAFLYIVATVIVCTVSVLLGLFFVQHNFNLKL
ncbi:CrcB family protein [bacterium]|nr:CrcB family protein [bacterium]